MTAIYWPDFATRNHLPEGSSWQHIGLIFRLLPTPFPSDALNEGKTRMAGLQSGEGRMMIDSVVWAQYINVTNTQTATSPLQMPPYALASGGENELDDCVAFIKGGIVVERILSEGKCQGRATAAVFWSIYVGNAGDRQTSCHVAW